MQKILEHESPFQCLNLCNFWFTITKFAGQSYDQIKHKFILGGMEQITMDPSGDSTEQRAQSSTTVTTASFRMSRFGNNKPFLCFQQEKE